MTVSQIDSFVSALKLLKEPVFHPGKASVYEELGIWAQKFDRKERYEYEESLKNYRDWFSVMQTAELRGEQRGMERGIQQGIQQGIAQGAYEANLAVARNLKQKGFSISEIAAVTGLTEEEISNL